MRFFSSLLPCALLAVSASANIIDDSAEKFLNWLDDGICPSGLRCGATAVRTSTSYTATETIHTTITRYVYETPESASTTTVHSTVINPVLVNDCITTTIATASAVATSTDVTTEVTTIILESSVITHTEYHTTQSEIIKHCTSTLNRNQAPTVALPSPTAIVGNVYSAKDDSDDESFYIASEFPVTLWGVTSTQIGVTTNGVLSLENKIKFPSFRNSGLPTREYPETSAFAFWDDLMIFKGTAQGIYYETTGKPGYRKLHVEWYCSKFKSPAEIYHFQTIYCEDRPNVLTYKYLHISDKGIGATIGTQGPGGRNLQHSFNRAIIEQGMSLEFDTDAGTINEIM